jgi:hypothetical protein
MDEGMFHHDELPDRDPDGYRLLWDYARRREPAVDWKALDPLTADAPVQIRLLGAAEMRELLYVAAYENRALVVCFNLPFDLSRLASGWTETRGGKTRKQRQESSFAGGFTLRYFEYHGTPNRYRPGIIRALRLVPVGRQRGLETTRLRGDVEINPRKHDLFRAAIERRRELSDENGPTGRFLKTFANGTSYGIYAEMVRRELPGGQREDVTVYGAGEQPFSAPVTAPEDPGRFAFTPMAATITAGARLMLATLEALVTQAGGSWAFCDTDSMAVVATEHGGRVPCPGGPERDSEGRECVRALSWAQIDEIVQRFQALNPYDSVLVPGSVLEIEVENYGPDGERRQLHCYSISSKRYALYNLDEHGQPTLRRIADGDENDEPAEGDECADALSELRKHSEHGLGHLLNPTDPELQSRDWIGQLWQYIIRTDAHAQGADGACLFGTRLRDRQDRLRSAGPEWLDRPALTRTTITSPRLLKPFEQRGRKQRSSKRNRKRSATDRVRPYNFGLVAHVHEPGLQGLPERFLLVAPYERLYRAAWNFGDDGPGCDRYIVTAIVASSVGVGG